MPLDAQDIQDLVKALKEIGSPSSGAAGNSAVKLPEFWTNDPELWFVRVEAQFATLDITEDDTKFIYTIAALDSTASAAVRSILLDPPAFDKYGELKSSLLAAFTKSQPQKDADLLTISGLGDQKPTELLQRIRSLNMNAGTLLRAFFLAQLPVGVRAFLAAQNITDIEELAKTADKMIETKAAAVTSNRPMVRNSISEGMALRNEKCVRCEKTVYQNERMEAGGHVWHRMCFRCATCDMSLKLNNYCQSDRILYCKKHYQDSVLSKNSQISY